MLLFSLAVIALPERVSAAGDSAGDTLSGRLIADVKPGARPFVVTGDLYVPAGITVTIAAGTVFLFEPFAALHVQGMLCASGTARNPVVFTSRNDHEWNPAASLSAAPFDWNGIEIDTTADGTEFSECIVRYSVSGITSRTDHFILNNVQFGYNGKTDLTVKGEQRPTDVRPYSYKVPRPAPLIALPAPKKNTNSPMALRATGLGLAIAGSAVGFWALSEYSQAQRRFDEINTPNADGVLLYTSADWNVAKQARDQDLVALLVGWGTALVGLTCVTVTFTF